MRKKLSPTVLRQAAQWLVRLDDEPGEALRNAFNAWLAEHPDHLDAVQRLQGSLAPLHELPRGPVRAALGSVAARPPIRRTLKALGLAAALLLPVGLALQEFPPAYLMADIRTGVGQWSTRQLSDGSVISLDARSAVDVHFDVRTRTVHLFSGEILVDVAKDASRPFQVVTEHGSVRALGTRFVVERLNHSTRLAMIESSTEVTSSTRMQVVSAGQQLRFDAAGLQPIETLDGAGLEQAWAQHKLYIKEQPLSEVLERLSRYQRGVLLFDEQALQAFKVTAVLPADDSERALRLLERSFPIKVEHFTPWLTRVTLKNP